MPQYARPASDVSNIGWTRSSGSSDYALIDESSADDADYIQFTWSGAANECEVGLSAISTPASTSGHIVRYRVREASLPSFVYPTNLSVSLLEGATVIASDLIGVGIVGTTWTDFSFNLSSTEAGNISDYSNLSLKFEMTQGDPGETIQVSWAEYQAPNAAAGSGGFDFTPDLTSINARFFDRPFPVGNGAVQDAIWTVYDNYEYVDLADENTIRDEYLWEVKPQGFHSPGYHICTWCGRKVHMGRAILFEGSWYCPEHQPRTDDKGYDAWEF